MAAARKIVIVVQVRLVLVVPADPADLMVPADLAIPLGLVDPAGPVEMMETNADQVVQINVQTNLSYRKGF